MFESYKDVLTPVQAAEILGVGRNSIYRFIKEGGISSIRIGRKIIIPKIYLIDFIEANRNKCVTIYSNYGIMHTDRASSTKGG